jgi:NADH-quinone oxidoreductase subunit M
VPGISFDAVGLAALAVGPAIAALILGLVSAAKGLVSATSLPAAAWLWSGLIVSLLVFAASLHLALVGFDPELLGLQRLEHHVWSPSLGANLAFAVDGLSLCFLLSTTGLVPLTFVTLRDVEAEVVPAQVVALLLLESALIGGLLAVNWMAFVACWALSGLPVLVWMARFGGGDRAGAAWRLWATEAIGLAGLLFVLFGLHESSLAQLGAPTLDLPGLGASADGTRGLLDVRLELEEQWPLFLAFALAVGTRLPVVPLHFWLPAAHGAAPTGLSVLIATGFVQIAAIGWMRFALPLVPDAAAAAGPVLSVLGIVALAYASLIALVQKELKRLVAYASVGYAGYALFGMSTLNVQGLTGAVIQLLTHGLATAGLFLLTGFLAARRGTTEVAAFGGLAKPMPVCAFFFGLMVLSLMGLPMLGGFVGDLFVLLGSLETRRTLSVLALLAMVVAASYLLWVQRRIFLGPVDEPANRGLIDLDRLERAALLAIALPIVAIGVHPDPVLRRVEPAVLELLYHMERRSVVPEPETEPPEPATGQELAFRGRADGGEP